jgi:diguanylate cyclase (GGDEF)-like protein/PAS domain S-box-containing protein
MQGMIPGRAQCRAAVRSPRCLFRDVSVVAVRTLRNTLAIILTLASALAFAGAAAQPAAEATSEVPRAILERFDGALAVAIAAAAILFLLLLLLFQRNRRIELMWRDLQQITAARKQDAQKLQELNHHFELFLDRTTDFIYFKDAQRRFIFVSRSFAELTGQRDRHALEGRSDADVFPADIAAEYAEQEQPLYDSGEMIADQRQRYERSDGSMGWMSTNKWPVFDNSGERVVGLFAISRDVTLQHDQEQELERAAHYDSLTGLPNRSLFHDRLRQAMAAADRRHTELAVVYLDVDHFKDVNDRHGHPAGDELLMAFAQKLLRSVRRSDTVSRFGGDEFVLLLADLDDRVECMALLDRLMVHIVEPVEVSGKRLEITASAGLAFYAPGEGLDADELLRQADQAMYRAKQAGRNRYRLLDEHEDGKRHALIARVEAGIAEGCFELHYQPIVDLRAGEVGAVEALLRWRQPSGELLLPDSVLPMLFGHPLAQDLEQFVLRSAIARLQGWRREGMELRLHVNAAAADFSQPRFIDDLKRLLGDDSLAPGSLCLEILESAAVADAATVNRTIRACGELGVHFALDDFGTGYSSLAHLKDLRADCVKIDQRFIQSMFSSYEDFSLLAAIVAMARAFGREVIAEGVETQAQARMLLRIGCHLAQGFALGRPMPADEFDRWLADWQPDPGWRGAMDPSDLALGMDREISRAAWQREKSQS